MLEPFIEHAQGSSPVVAPVAPIAVLSSYDPRDDGLQDWRGSFSDARLKHLEVMSDIDG